MKILNAYRGPSERARRLMMVGLGLLAYAGLTVASYRELRSDTMSPQVQVALGNRPPTRNVSVQGAEFWVDGEPFFVKAVGWDPVRPGEYPWERTFNAEEVSEDFARIRAAGFNTIRTWAPLSPEELALAARHDLRVLQGVWVPPDGDFADSEFRRETLASVAQAVEGSRWSPAVLGYLVLNEPRAEAVAKAGLEDTQAFLREVVATVRALDPSAPIGYASWPGLEVLDDPLLDFVAFNLYPHRPRVVMQELGLLAYTNMIRETVAKGRPLLVSEFGLSVSPGLPLVTPGRGGATPEEQAQGLVDLASTFATGQVGGLAVFQWSDGWWKNNEVSGDPNGQDPMDPEEWFGLIEFEDIDDRHGKPRPALAAYSTYQRAVLVEPASGRVAGEEVSVRIASAEDLRVEVSDNGREPHSVALERTGASWSVGKVPLAGNDERHDLEFRMFDSDGELVRTERRLLRVSSEPQVELSLSPQLIRVAPGETFTVELQISAASGVARETGVTIASYTEAEFHEGAAYLVTDAEGRVTATLRAPAKDTMLTVIAFENAPDLPPGERATAWAAVEVRRGNTP